MTTKTSVGRYFYYLTGLGYDDISITAIAIPAYSVM
jgi:hypothetical protein